MKYLKLFPTVSSAIGTVDSPSVSYINGNEQLMIKSNDNGDSLLIEKINDQKVFMRAPYDYLTFTCIEAGTIKFFNNSGNVNMDYKLNGNDWVNWAFDDKDIDLSAGDVLKLKGYNPDGLSDFETVSNFGIYSGKFSVSGNIMSLIYGVADGSNAIPNDYCFNNLFPTDCLTTMPALSAVHIKEGTYSNFFLNGGNIIVESVEQLMAVDADYLDDDMFACGTDSYEGKLKTITCGDYVNKYDGHSQYFDVTLSDGNVKTFTMWSDSGGCFAAGTKIMMADKTVKNVEDVKEGDLVLTFNHETGKMVAEKVLLSFKGVGVNTPLTLYFTHDKTLSIIQTHSILERSSLKYVRINKDNVESYIGKEFYNASKSRWETLLSYEIGATQVRYYCIYSGNVNCIANDFLTAPDDSDYELNIYELNKRNLKADAKTLAADIEQYGLLNVEEKCQKHPELYDTLYTLGKYIYIAMGKGLVTREEILKTYSFWDHH